MKCVEWEEAQVLGRVELWTSRVRGYRSCDSQQVARVCAAHPVCSRGEDLSGGLNGTLAAFLNFCFDVSRKDTR
jgi:hypothetical protein